MKEALVMVSFGTSHADAAASIVAVEQRLAQLVPTRQLVRVYTSRTIRTILAKRGEMVPSLEEALDALAADGVADVLVQPTHLLPGIEYDKIVACVREREENFRGLHVGGPLLGTREDVRRLAELLVETYPPCEGEALLFIGHGTEHAAHLIYPAVQGEFRLLGRCDILLGVVEGEPNAEELLRLCQSEGFRAVHLLPLMLVGGEHAKNDIAGPSGSWQSLFQEHGFTVRATLTGLGLLPPVAELYAAHLQTLLTEHTHGL